MKNIFKIVTLLFLGLFLIGCQKEDDNKEIEEEKGWLDSIHTTEITEPKFGNIVNHEDSEEKIVISYINVSISEAKAYVLENKDKFPIDSSIVDMYDQSKIYKFTGGNGRSDITILLDTNTFVITVERR
jgi:hypothetical protein